MKYSIIRLINFGFFLFRDNDRSYCKKSQEQPIAEIYGGVSVNEYEAFQIKESYRKTKIGHNAKSAKNALLLFINYFRNL